MSLGTAIRSITAPDGTPADICLPGDKTAWIAGFLTDTIYHISLVDGTVINTIPSPGVMPTGVTTDGRSLYIAVFNTLLIYQIDFDGTIIRSFATPGTFPRSLSYDGRSLWTDDSGADLIYQLDISDGSVIKSFSSPGSLPVGTIVIGDGYIYTIDLTSGLLYTISQEDGTVILSAASGAANPNQVGIDFDGRSLWIGDLSTTALHQIMVN